jgi:hypothetical protein
MSSETDDLFVETPQSRDRPTTLPAGPPPEPKSASNDQLAASANPPDGPPAIASSSADGLTASLSQLSPDPFLEEFQPAPTGAGTGAPGPVPSTALGSAGLDATDLDVPPSAEIPAILESVSGVTALVGALGLGTDGSVAPRPSSSEGFPALDLYAPPPSTDAGEPAQAEVAAKDPEDWDEDGDDGLPWWCSPRIVVLLVSYASAVTLGLIWVLWGHRTVRDGPSAESDPFSSAETVAEPGRRAGQSRKFLPPPPLPSDRIVALGQTVRLRSLEVTPLEVGAGSVILTHEIRQREARRGGDDALLLKLRLTNISSDEVFVPLDEDFIRERGEGVRDSFIELGPTQQIDMFSLAIASEWSIAGQEFRELNPGEWYETLVVSAPDAARHVDPETMITWRVRLRVDADNTTEILGIRFRTSDIQKRPARDLQDQRAPTERPEPDNERSGLTGNR